METTAKHSNVSHVIAGTLLITAIITTVIGLLEDWPWIPTPWYFLPKKTVIAFGLLLAIASILSHRIPKRIALAAASVTIASYLAVHLLMLGAILSGRQVWLNRQIEDARFGIAPEPNSRQAHWHLPAYHVIYTLDADGWRITPAPTEIGGG